MGLEKLIKRELAITALTIIFVVLGFFTFSYALFMDVDTVGNATITFGDIELKFCEDASCTSELSTYANIIGTQTIDGITSPTKIYPINSSTALSQTPYSFTIKNTGSLPIYVSLYLEQDSLFEPQSSYMDYSAILSNDLSNIVVACAESGTGNPTISRYNDLENGLIMDNVFLDPNEKKTYNVWAWVDESATNAVQGTYFTANITAKSEYIPVSMISSINE